MEEAISVINFWMVIFLTCTVGLIEFLPELEHWNERRRFVRLYKFTVFFIYFGFLSGAVVGIYKSIAFYKTGLVGSPFLNSIISLLGFEGFQYLSIISLTVSFTLLFLFKTFWRLDTS